MATKTWIGAETAGQWSVTGNWSGGTPVSGDVADIGKNFTATGPWINVNQDIGNVSLILGDTLATYYGVALTGTALNTPSTFTWNIPSGGVSIEVRDNGLSGDAFIQVPMAGSGSITKTGSGYLYFNTNASTTGLSSPFVIEAGAIGFGTASNRLGSGQITLKSNATLLNTSTTTGLSLQNSLFVDAASGTAFLNGIRGVGGQAALTVAGSVVFASGTSTLNILSATTFSGNLSGGNFTKAGSATLTLSGSTTHNSTVKVTAGTLSLTNINALQNAIVDWGTATVGSLTWSNANTVLGGLNSASGTANVLSLGANALLVGNANTDETFTGTFGTTAASLTKVGIGKWTLTNNGTTRTGATTVTGGELELTASNAIGNTTTGGVVVASLGTLTLNGTGISVPAKATTLSGLLQNKTGSNTWSGTISTVSSETTAEIRNVTAGTTFTLPGFTLAAGSTITLSGAGNLTKASNLQSGTNSVTLVKNDAGTFSLNGLNIYGGTFRLNAGTVNATAWTVTSGTETVEINGGSFVNTASMTFGGTFSGTGGNISCANATARTLSISTTSASVWSGYFGSAVANGNNFALTVSGTQLVLRGTTASTHSGNTTLSSTATLDSAHAFSNTGVVNVGSGSTIGAGGWDGSTGGLGDFTVPTLTFTSTTGTIRSSKANAATAQSKVVVTGTLTKPSTTLTILGAGTGWSAGTQYEIASAASIAGAGALAVGSWTDSANARIGGGTATTIGTSIYLTPAATNVSTTWAGGGAGGAWFNEQPTGWSQTGPAFLNGDTVVFSTGNTTTATLTSDVSVASLTLQGSPPQTIDGVGFSIANAGALNIAAGIKTINVPMTTAGDVVFSTSGTLVVGHVNALAGAGTTFNMNASQASFTANASITTTRNLVLLSSASTNTLTKTGGTTLSFGGSVSGSVSSGIRPSLFIKGHGVLEFTASSTTHFNIYEVDDSTTTPGQNVYRATVQINSLNTGLKLGSGGIYENATGGSLTFNRAYGSSFNQFQVVSGGGFSRKTTGTMTVSANLTYGASAATEWVGAAYFGTAFGTQEGSVTFSGTQNLNGQTQTFYVFDGATTAGSSATISGKISGSGTFIKDGPGKLTVSNATNDFTASVEVDDGTLVASSANVLNSRDVTVAANKTLQTLSTSGVALRTGNLTLGANARIIVGA